jgi:hypothetical protein
VNKGNKEGDESAGSGEKKRGVYVASGAVTRNASASYALVHENQSFFLRPRA